MLTNRSKNGDAESPPPKPAGPNKNTIEKTFKKKTQLEHILLRPDTYIGSVEHTKQPMWIYDTENSKMVQKKIDYVPGLYKIFDEILVNAADNKQRDKKMDCIKIEINQENNVISVWNNGQGVPVVMHKDEKMYVPTMIFGHLLTSSNFNDEEEKVTGGRNGYGAKLCNVFSTKFTVETSSREYRKHFKQSWGANMTKTSEPKIKEYSGEEFTKITFSPDLEKFKMEKLDDDIVGLFSKRAFDVAAWTRGVKVFLNGEKLPVKNFKEYIDLYIKNNDDDGDDTHKLIYESPNERWEVAVTTSDYGFRQVSFVNSIATSKGGKHVDHVVDMITKYVGELLKKKNKGGIAIQPDQIKNHRWVFINCLILKPSFDSQSKEMMTSTHFGYRCNLSDKFFNAVAKGGIIENTLLWARIKKRDDMAKMSGRKQTKLKDNELDGGVGVVLFVVLEDLRRFFGAVQ
uniref:DNA topoisomerase 2 n=1 Tax=Photinus pyralis TaxID=7054 RepID=A0A1Y1MXH5_PHOPY